MIRSDGRFANDVRPISIAYNVCGNADGSVLFTQGNTKVLCTVLIQDGVPAFLKGKGQGWLTAEYTMLPAATRVRTPREITLLKRNNRSVEISRLIGRALRSIVDLSKLGEKTLYIDCDVIQADGGTRTASITGAYCALFQANARWMATKESNANFLMHSVAAVSVGWFEGQPLLDVNFQEDVEVQADFNFVLTGANELVEIQGGTEGAPLPWHALDDMKATAIIGIQDIFMAVRQSQSSMLITSLLHMPSKNFSRQAL